MDWLLHKGCSVCMRAVQLSRHFLMSSRRFVIRFVKSMLHLTAVPHGTLPVFQLQLACRHVQVDVQVDWLLDRGCPVCRRDVIRLQTVLRLQTVIRLQAVQLSRRFLMSSRRDVIRFVESMPHLTAVPHGTLPVFQLQLASRHVQVDWLLDRGCPVCRRAMQLSRHFLMSSRRDVM